MTEMNAVKIPHGDDRPQIRSMKIFDVAENFHISRVPGSPDRYGISMLRGQPETRGRITGAVEL
jgi:hypothetical protein